MGACTGTTLRSASSWDRDARWANLFWNKLCSLGSGSGLPPITSGFSTVSPTTQWSHLRILLWRPPHLPTAPGNHLQPPRLPDPVCPLRGVGHLSPSSSPAHCAGRPPPLLRHHLPPPPLRSRPPPPLPPQAARARSASC